MRDGQKKLDTKPAAVDGVLREQRQKWQSVCRDPRLSYLTTEMFEIEILSKHLQDVLTAQQKWATAKNKNTTEGETDGRKLAEALR